MILRKIWKDGELVSIYSWMVFAIIVVNNNLQQTPLYTPCQDKKCDVKVQGSQLKVCFAKKF